MLYELRNRVARALYDRRCGEILDTPPLSIKSASLIFCSMVSQRDFMMYLVAIKSVYSRIGEGRICIINDGSLRADAIAMLEQHLGAPRIVDISSIATGSCPRGGTWERLLHILDLAEESYVIQVDSDILARASIKEVAECYQENRSFTLGSWAGQSLQTLAEAAAYAGTLDNTHVQIAAERVFTQLNDATKRFYVRGSSGFAGFARGGSSRRVASDFSAEMETMLGDRWSAWGTEQVTSCYVVANTPGSTVLPWPKYTNFSSRIDLEAAALVHFVGDQRFYRGRYARESQRIIAELRTP